LTTLLIGLAFCAWDREGTANLENLADENGREKQGGQDFRKTFAAGGPTAGRLGAINARTAAWRNVWIAAISSASFAVSNWPSIYQALTPLARSMAGPSLRCAHRTSTTSSCRQRILQRGRLCDDADREGTTPCRRRLVRRPSRRAGAAHRRATTPWCRPGTRQQDRHCMMPVVAIPNFSTGRFDAGFGA
jgi:hypothetical protein